MFTNTKTLSLNNNVADIKFEKGRGEKTMKQKDSDIILPLNNNLAPADIVQMSGKMLFSRFWH